MSSRELRDGLRTAAVPLCVIGLSAAAAIALGSRAGAAMFGVSFFAITAASVLGGPARSLAVVGIGVACLVWLVLAGAIGQPGPRSVVAHALAGALLGWALADGILRSPGLTASVERIIAAAVLATLAIGVVWELWELATDAAAGSDLSGGIADTALDLAADCLGALAGGTLAVGGVRASAAAG